MKHSGYYLHGVLGRSRVLRPARVGVHLPSRGASSPAADPPGRTGPVARPGRVSCRQAPGVAGPEASAAGEARAAGTGSAHPTTALGHPQRQYPHGAVAEEGLKTLSSRTEAPPPPWASSTVSWRKSTGKRTTLPTVRTSRPTTSPSRLFIGRHPKKTTRRFQKMLSSRRSCKFGSTR